MKFQKGGVRNNLWYKRNRDNLKVVSVSFYFALKGGTKINNKSLLVVTDMQNDCICNDDCIKIIPLIQRKIEKYCSNNDLIIFTMNTHNKNSYNKTIDYNHYVKESCINNTHGWEIVDSLKVSLKYLNKNFKVVNKVDSLGYMNFKDDIRSMLKVGDRLSTIEVVGLYTETSVLSNALILKSLYNNLEVYVDPSCCASIKHEYHDKAIDIMNNCLINIVSDYIVHDNHIIPSSFITIMDEYENNSNKINTENLTYRLSSGKVIKSDISAVEFSRYCFDITSPITTIYIDEYVKNISEKIDILYKGGI